MNGAAGSVSQRVDGDEPFPAPLRDAFLERARITNARKDQIVIAEGSDALDVYLIRTGRLQFSLVSAHGREVILRDMGADRLFGELAALDGRPRSVSVVALTDCTLAWMSGPAFLAFLEEVPQAALWIARQLVARVRDLTERTFELATFPVSSRVQAELLRLAAAFGADPAADRVVIQPMPTHVELAARTGTRREAVSRELNQLAKEGLVAQRGRKLEILSLSGLRALHERLLR